MLLITGSFKKNFEIQENLHMMRKEIGRKIFQCIIYRIFKSMLLFILLDVLFKNVYYHERVRDSYLYGF